MTGKHYLIKALGLSAIPKILTFVLTLISFPLMVRAIGSTEYGIVVYFTSIVVLFDAPAAGVVAATGKAIAAVRAGRIASLSSATMKWLQLLVLVSSAGLLASGAIGGYLLHRSGYMSDAVMYYLLLAVTSWIAALATFAKVVLTSLLSFARVAAIDTAESVLRSLGWLFVAFIVPSALALIVAGLLTALVVLLLAVPVLLRSLARMSAGSSGLSIDAAPPRRYMLRESTQFFAVSLATRAFQSGPLIVLERVLGPDVIGVLGALGRVVEMLAFPMAIIANALAVRAHEMREKGLEAIREYWRVIVRTGVVTAAVAGGLFIVSSDIADAMLPESSYAGAAFAMIALLYLARTGGELVAPASDYVGGLGRRTIWLVTCSVFQLPIIWAAAIWFGDVGAIAAVVGVYAVMVGGYISIAKHALFGRASMQLPNDILIALIVIAAALIGALLSTPWVAFLSPSGPAPSVLALATYCVLLVAAFGVVPNLKRTYPTLRFLEF